MYDVKLLSCLWKYVYLRKSHAPKEKILQKNNLMCNKYFCKN